MFYLADESARVTKRDEHVLLHSLRRKHAIIAATTGARLCPQQLEKVKVKPACELVVVGGQ